MYGIYKPVLKLIKLMCFALGFYKALLGLLNPTDEFTISLGKFQFLMVVCSL